MVVKQSFKRWAWAMTVCCLGCGDWRADPDGFTEADLALIRSMALTAAPTDPGNEYAADPEVAALGQALFFDKQLSVGRDGGVGADGGVQVIAVACSDCHSPREWFSDERGDNNVSRGVGVTARNSPSLVNVAFYGTFGWDGRADSVWGQCHHAYAAGATMAGSPALLLAAVRARYADRYQAVFGTPLTDPVDLDAFYRTILKTWAAYLVRLTSANAPFDRFALGEREALSVEQRRGLRLFLGKAGCIECHSGPNFSDNRYHSVGIGQSGPGVPAVDKGRADGLEKLKALKFRPAGAAAPDAPTDGDVGQFRTKSLRQVSKTAPYFHAGQVATLKDVVWFYSRGGDHEGVGPVSPFLVPLGLSEPEQADLVAFLESLTGGEVAEALRCDASRASVAPRSFAACAEIR
jgi:cytochrome c peroxidase